MTLQTLKTHKKFAILLLVTLLIAAGIAWYLHRPTNTALVLHGNVDIRQVALTFNASERIATMNVEEGDRVHKGDVLATLNTLPLELSIHKCQTDIAQQQAIVAKMHNGSRPEEIAEAAASMQSAQAEAENAAADYRRMSLLYAKNAISKQSLDAAEAKAKSTAANLAKTSSAHELAFKGYRQEDIAAADAQLQSLQTQLQTAQYNLSQATLVAPQDGVIRSRLLEPGDMASPSTPVYTLSLDKVKWIRAYISENALGHIYEGQKATISIDSANKTIEGQVGYISNTAEFTPKSVETEELRTSLVYEVRIYVNDTDNVLRLGMPATVTF